MSKKILIVDDEEDILMLVSYNLSKEGYSIKTATSGEDALKLATSDPFDLIILDLMLPNINGLKVCEKLKLNQETKAIPIVMLTAKSEETDIVKGLETGADDYITKPFSPKVLIARIKALLRREDSSKSKFNDKIHLFELVIDPSKHEVLLKDQPIELTNTEFKVLQLLATNPGRVFSRYQIVEAVKGTNHCVTDRSVDVVIVGLRKRFGEFSDYIETVRGVGYRFKE